MQGGSSHPCPGLGWATPVAEGWPDGGRRAIPRQDVTAETSSASAESPHHDPRAEHSFAGG